MTNFADVGLSPSLMQAVESVGYASMTEVQAQTLPLALAGDDVIVQAKTGSGKTATFALAILARLEPQLNTVMGTSALVLCPTRELADQVTGEIRRLAARIPNVKVVTLCGGVPAREQVPALLHAPHIVVGTPGRILDHLERGTLELHNVQTLVLDEADRMLDMGFETNVVDIIRGISPQRQTLLFSATIPDGIAAMSRKVQSSPKAVTVDVAAVSDAVEEIFFDVPNSQKIDAVVALLAHYRPANALVFCTTRNDVKRVAETLSERGFNALPLHGEMEQRDRDEVFIRFANGSCDVLVATDVAARGLDVKELAVVISYELPRDTDIHIHRTGRTGRAGHQGLALHLVAPQENSRAKAIAADRGQRLTWAPLPTPAAFVPPPPSFVTLVIGGGRKDKVRPGDILGALTGDVGLDAAAVGKIVIQPARSYVAVSLEHARTALSKLGSAKIKGRKFRVSQLR